MLTFPNSSQLQRLAALTSIVSQTDQRQVAFRFNAEQLDLAKRIGAVAVPRFIVTKSRQIGTSTFFCFLDVAVAILNPGVRIAIVVDTQVKATELLERCRSFIKNLGLTLLIENTRKLKLSNGSEIHALTATGGIDGQESRAGRSQSFQMLHLSELPYWPNQAAYGALLATCPDAPVFIESTAKGTGDLFWRLWNGANDYQKVFFSIERHAAYQAPPETLSDLQWSEAQSLGFTSKPHAAWWYRKLASQGNDLIRHLHDYPVSADHPFLTFEGRWIQTTPAILPYVWQESVKVFAKPERYHRYLCAVDTSGGVGRDGNALVVLDRTTKQLVAFWNDNRADIEDVCAKMLVVQRLYNPDVFVIETNGIGQATYQRAKRLGLPIKELTTTEDTKYAGLLACKKAVESGLISGPEELAEECASLHLDAKGRFKGRKDSCMALGFALMELVDNYHIIPQPSQAETVYDPSRFLNSNKTWY